MLASEAIWKRLSSKSDLKRIEAVSQGVPISRVARRKRTGRLPLGRAPLLPDMPKPSSAILTERFDRPVCVEHLDARARNRMDIEERFKFSLMTANAATSLGCARAKPRK